MDLHLDSSKAPKTKYHGGTQIARVVTEGWLEDNMYCPVCGEAHLVHFKASKPVADFYCPHCKAEFEQKSKDSKHARIPKTVAGGAYSAMEARLLSETNPHLFVLTYADGKVNNLLLVPKHFFTMSVVKKRKPLSATAVRAGWTGSNILLDEIPESGRIYIIKNGVEENPLDVLKKYKLTLPLKTVAQAKRGWLMDVLKCVEAIPTADFTLADVYAFSSDLEKKHPGNAHIKDKIRQQLQTLRDKGFIVFVSRGNYKRII